MSVNLLPKGINFTRHVIARALADGEPHVALEIAAARWGPTSPPVRMIKAATPGLASDSDLAPAETAETEFIALIAQRSIVGRLAGLRRVPERTRMLEQTSGSGAAWVAEGAAVSVTAPVFTASTLDTLKLMGAVVVTDELLRAASVEGELLIRNDLARVLVEELDTAFIDPTNAGTANEKPASITNGVTAVTATGTFKDDLEALVADFDGALDAAFFIASPEYAVSIAGADFPAAGARGGEVSGVPLIVSRSAPADHLVLVDPTRIALVESGLEVKTSRQGAVQMDTEPTQDSITPTATSLVSLWQNNSVGISAMIRTNWSAAAGAVSVLEPAP